MKLRHRPVSAVLVEAALTGFRGNISVAGSAVGVPLAVDVHVEDGAVTYCSGFVSDKEIKDEECLEIILSAECVNCGAELTRLPPEGINRRFRRVILADAPTVSERIHEKSLLLKERVSPSEIMLKGRMTLFARASIEDGLRALATLSVTKPSALLVPLDHGKFVAISSKGIIMAAYLRIRETEYLGVEALRVMRQVFEDRALIQIFALPEGLINYLIQE